MSTIGETSAQFALRDPDVRLMLRVRNDEHGAFEELVDRFQHRLINILAHLCCQADEAEDLAQEVFLRVYRSRSEYHPQAKFSTWLFTIANNVALNALRRRIRKPSIQLTVTDSGPMGARPIESMLTARTASPDHNLQFQELAQVIRNALDQLNDRQRMAVVLNKFEGMSYDEIAQVMGITTKAVKSLLSRARCQLRDLLKDYVQMDTRSASYPALSESGASDAQ